MVYQYSVFDEVKDVVKVSQVSDVDDLSPGEKKGSSGNFEQACQKILCIEFTVIMDQELVY